jgi:hypothetical protein
MSFGTDVLAFSRKTGVRMDKVLRKVVIDMTTAIVKLTPVATGMAKNNFFWGFDRVGTKETGLSKTGAASVSRAAEFSREVKHGGVFYLTNNLPYIMALEYGHSKAQAPSGMARITVARFQQIVNAAVNGVR